MEAEIITFFVTPKDEMTPYVGYEFGKTLDLDLHVFLTGLVQKDYTIHFSFKMDGSDEVLYNFDQTLHFVTGDTIPKNQKAVIGITSFISFDRNEITKEGLMEITVSSDYSSSKSLKIFVQKRELNDGN